MNTELGIHLDPIRPAAVWVGSLSVGRRTDERLSASVDRWVDVLEGSPRHERLRTELEVARQQRARRESGSGR